MAVRDANGTRLTEQDYQFGWEPLSPEPSPGGRRPEPASSSVLQNPAILSLMVVLAMAVLILCYYKIVSRFLASCPRRSPESESAGDDGFFGNAEPAADADFFPEDGPWAAVPCGVDEAVIRAIPVAKFCTARKLLSSPADCAVCLVEFREQEPVRVLPRCGHAFHLPCIDVWLRSHASCPLCRACIAASMSRRWDWYDSQPEPQDEAGVPEPANGPAPKLTRSVSLGRVAADDAGSLLSAAAGFDPETPWPAPPTRRAPGTKWSKRTLSLVSPFVPRSSSSFFGRSPFFRASCGPALSFRFGRRFRGGSFSMSPPHGGGLWRGGVVSEHYVNVGRFQCMSSPPVFVKRSSGTFSLTPNRMRAGDPEALLSPERINLSRRWR